jgi:hypothetical protein
MRKMLLAALTVLMTAASGCALLDEPGDLQQMERDVRAGRDAESDAGRSDAEEPLD